MHVQKFWSIIFLDWQRHSFFLYLCFSFRRQHHGGSDGFAVFRNLPSQGSPAHRRSRQESEGRAGQNPGDVQHPSWQPHRSKLSLAYLLVTCLVSASQIFDLNFHFMIKFCEAICQCLHVRLNKNPIFLYSRSLTKTPQKHFYSNAMNTSSTNFSCVPPRCVHWNLFCFNLFPHDPPTAKFGQ